VDYCVVDTASHPPPTKKPPISGLPTLVLVGPTSLLLASLSQPLLLRLLLKVLVQHGIEISAWGNS
jgi:hypothetical protein